MKDIKINLLNVISGVQDYSFEIDDSFFKKFENEEEFNNSSINAKISIQKDAYMYKMVLSINGEIDLVCDLTNEVFRKNICNEFIFFIKFGDYYDEDIDVITLEKNNTEIVVDKYIYESVIFSIPLKKMHPILVNESEMAKYDCFIINNHT